MWIGAYQYYEKSSAWCGWPPTNYIYSGVLLTPVCSILAARVINSGTKGILLTHAGFHPTSQLAEEDAIVPSTSFPSGVPPVALAPVHKTPNLRFLHRHPGTPTLTSRGSSRVSAQDSPPLASNSKPGIRVAFVSIHVSNSYPGAVCTWI